MLNVVSSFINSRQLFKKLFKVLTFSNFLFVFMWSYVGGIPYTCGLSYKGGVVEVDAIYYDPINSFLSYLYMSISFLGSKNGGGSVVFLTHNFVCFPCFITSSPVLTP